MSYPPEDFLSLPLIRQLAGDKPFATGEAYFSEGRVRQFQAAADRATGRVEGSREYRVKLWKSRGEFQFSCGCPAGQENAFCKHCVAVGLAWLAASGNGGATSGPEKDSPAAKSEQAAKAETSRRKLEDHLRILPRERLVELVLEATDFDDILRRRLLLETTGVSRQARSPRGERDEKVPDLEAYGRLLHEAIATADYVDYEAMPDYAQGVQEAVSPLGTLLRDGYAEAVVQLAEYALIELDKASDRLDASDGSLNPIYDDLQRFHLQACRAARPDPESLAVRLLEYELDGGLGVFNNAVHAYGEVLGESGLQAWRRKLVDAWSKLPPAADSVGSIDHRRFQLQALMERLAASEGDVALVTAIKERDLTSAHDYLALAEFHAEQGQHERAITRAEEGLRTVPAGHDDIGLRDFLMAAYERVGETASARDLIWSEFLRVADQEAYRRLREHFHRFARSRWPAWRKRALRHLREAATRKHADGSMPVEILLDEHRYDDAWREALAHGCRLDIWLRLAAKRERKHPADALGVYRARLEPTLAAGGATAYREAIELLDKIRALLGRLGRGEDFVSYRAEIRAAHRQKRGFLKLLDADPR